MGAPWSPAKSASQPPTVTATSLAPRSAAVAAAWLTSSVFPDPDKAMTSDRLPTQAGNS